jgi:hypothetical protein
MRFVLVVAFLTSFAFAADPAAVSSACGPSNTKFDVSTEKNAPAPTLQEGKALVYVIEVFDRPRNQLGKPTTKVGLDGSWIGANKDNSYLAFPVEPGDHHLCVTWQSVLKTLSKNVGLASFSAEAGKTYYFRARITQHGEDYPWFTLDLDPVNGDKAQSLLASSPLSTSHPKK